MTSITETLPPELLSRVFFFLSGDQQHIAASRLVCHTFKELSSPFLITRAHPYFRRYVSELIWDASVSDKSEYDSLEEYVLSCQLAPRRFRDSKRRDAEQRRLAQCKRLEELSCDDADRWTGAPLAGVCGDRLPAAITPNPLHSDIVDEDDEGPDIDMDRAERLGLIDAYQIYRERWRSQKQIEDSALMKTTLAHAFAKLPKLQRLTFADYRVLATGDESFDDCCRRLFGNVLQPLSLGIDFGNPAPFPEFLRAVASVAPEGRIQSLSIPRHPFETRQGMQYYGNSNPRYPIYVRGEHLVNYMQETPNGFGGLFTNLRVLRLPISTYELSSHANFIISMKGMLSQMTSTLTHLTVSIDAPEFDEMYDHKCFFDDMLGALHFISLQLLDLRGWYLPCYPLKMFLAVHASTLREVRFLNCLLSTDSLDMGDWGAKHLRLTGIELAPPVNPGFDAIPGVEEE
ncbi:hypothetical protein LTR85_007644 [Meristemomyces frigidus]|nr:hypothetical protein LTR85_007644 [Meristemomyces frigidus]